MQISADSWPTISPARTHVHVRSLSEPCSRRRICGKVGIRRAQSVKDTYEDRILAKTFILFAVATGKVRVLSQVGHPRQECSTYSAIYYSQRRRTPIQSNYGIYFRLRPNSLRVRFTTLVETRPRSATKLTSARTKDRRTMLVQTSFESVTAQARS